MASGANIKFGILRTRDLVELWLAGRVSAISVTTNQRGFNNAGSGAELVPVNPARMRLEIICGNPSNSTTESVEIAERLDDLGNGFPPILLLPGTSFLLVREYEHELDAVCAAVYALASHDAVVISTRETILTPLPVDESP